MRKLILFFAATLVLFCSGWCIKTNDLKQYDFSTDYVQIGCRVNTGNQQPETSYSRIAFPWWYDNNKNAVIYGLDLAPAIYDNGTLYGLGISLASMRSQTNGVIIAPLCSIQKKTCGLSLSLVNVTLTYSPGLQTGLWNIGDIAIFETTGGASVQLACLNLANNSKFQLGLCNICNIRNVCQIGLANFGYTVYRKSIQKGPKLEKIGCQLGLYNYSENSIFQIGLLNYNANSAFCKWFPIVNFSVKNAAK